MRNTGPSRKVREQVYSRDGWVCVFCGTNRNLTWQHRRNRGAGGSKDPDINTTVNGLTLCLRHNLAAEHEPQWAREMGYKVPSWSDPADEPVRYPDGWYRLTFDGGREPAPQPARG